MTDMDKMISQFIVCSFFAHSFAEVAGKHQIVRSDPAVTIFKGISFAGPTQDSSNTY